MAPALDPLTNALPKTAFEERMAKELESARATDSPVSLLVIDIDHFKSINDAFGHARGDEILREFAARAHEALRPSDVLVRNGGDEFVVIFPDTPHERALDLARDFLQEVTRTPMPGDPPLGISLSIGVATFPEHASSAETLFHAADARLYVAKRRGRGQVAGEDAVDAPATPRLSSRLVERDQEVEALYAFLTQLAARGRGVLTVRGAPGTGRTRFLHEATKGARLLGYEVVPVRATPALRHRALGALVEGVPWFGDKAREGLEAMAAATELCVRAEGRRGLVLVIDDYQHLDPESLELIRRLLEHPTPTVLALVCAIDPADAEHTPVPTARSGATVELQPLSLPGVHTWLRVLLQWEPPTEFLGWFHHETRGLPGHVEAALPRLGELGVLCQREGEWRLEEEFHNLALGAWLHSRTGRRGSMLPTGLATLVGRDEEIAAAKRLLLDGRLLTLFGPGGFGKTRLAIQIAAEVEEYFSHGVFVVPLSTVATADAVLPAAIEALGLAFRSGAAPREQLIEFLRDKSALLVLDNFEHVMAAAPLVADLLANAPQLKVLVSSRETLNLAGEHELHVRGMPLPPSDEVAAIERSPSVQLFLRHARHHRRGFAPTPAEWVAIAHICRRLMGIPLAIELAAALIRALPCEEILQEIERDLDALVTRDQDTPDRHRSLRAVFDYSWQLLSEKEQEVLRRLAIFRGGFRRDAAGQVAGASFPLLLALADKSLLHSTTYGRYEIHETLRHYAYERLLEQPEERELVENRRCAYFALMITRRGRAGARAPRATSLAWIADEMENVRAAFRWAVEHGRVREAEQLTRGLYRFLVMKSRSQEGRDLFRWASRRAIDPSLQVMALTRYGYFCSKLGDYRKAESLLRRSLSLARRIRREDDVALAFFGLGYTALQLGRYPEAERLLRRSLRRYRQRNWFYGQALCLNELGVLALYQGKLADAERRFQRSLQIRTAIGEQAGMAVCLGNLGMIADLQGRRAEARELFERSLMVSREAADRRQIATSLNNLGVFARRLFDEQPSIPLLHEARRFLHEALEIYTEIGVRENVALALYNLADIATALGEYEEAEARFLDAMRRAADLGATPLLLTVFVGIARLLGRNGIPGRAVELLNLVVRHPAAVDEDRQVAQGLLKELGEPTAEVRAGSAAGLGAANEVRDLVRKLSRGIIRNEREGRVPATSESAAPASAPSRALPGEDVESLIQGGQAAEREAQPAFARTCYEAALKKLTPDTASQAASLLRWIARTHIAEGDLSAAEDCLEASLASAVARNDLTAEAHGMNLRGIMMFQRGEMDTAVQAYTASREMAQQASEAQLVPMIDHNLGVIANVRGQVERALEHFRASLNGFRQLGLTDRAAEVLNSLGMIYTDLRRYLEAEKCYAEVIESCTASGSTHLRLMAEANRIELWIEQRKYHEASTACRSAVDLAQQLGDQRALGELHMHSGVLARETGRYVHADHHLGRATAIAEETNNVLLSAETAREQAELFWRQQRHQETLQALNRAHRCFAQLQARRDLADVDRQMGRLEEIFVEIVRRWSESIESADAYTQGHCVRVADYACLLAKVTGMDEKTLFWFRLGALLHDVGKIVVPSEVLNKPGQLTPEERQIIERHPDAGVELLADIEFPWDIRPMVRHHHERWEGRGYPTGIAGEEIPLSARILCIADVYDALTTDRPYRAGFSYEKAIDIMENGMRGHFDPDLFALFKRIVAPVESPKESGSNTHLRVIRAA